MGNTEKPHANQLNMRALVLRLAEKLRKAEERPQLKIQQREVQLSKNKKIPTVGRQTSWLFTTMTVELN